MTEEEKVALFRELIKAMYDDNQRTLLLKMSHKPAIIADIDLFLRHMHQGLHDHHLERITGRRARLEASHPDLLAQLCAVVD